MFNVSGISIDQLAESELDVLKVSNAYSDAVMSYQGAQVLEFYSKVKQQPLLWLSELNSYQAGTAIRGGIPLCFPWFSAHSQHADFPAHGFARNLKWKLVNVIESEAGHEIIFELRDSNVTRRYWDVAFKLSMHIYCGEKLQLMMQLSNLDTVDIEFSFAWHSYFPAKTEIAKISGLDNTTYIDQLNNNKVQNQFEQQIEFKSELDRIYPLTRGQFVLEQDTQHQIFIRSTAKSAIIWNPWIDKSRRILDIRDDAWQDFVCIECGQIASEKVFLKVGEMIQFELCIE